jgi:S-adenosylmethionine:tRNA-ribosyltransferase-isomerase (queuine synthetase)
MFSFKLTKKNGNLVHINETTKISYQLFLDKLQEGQEVEVFMGLTSDNGSLAQLAKIHACIRELAKESGYTFDEMKFIVKKHSGLCYDGGGAEYCKSFKECSKEELAMAIESAIELGRDLNINLA